MGPCLACEDDGHILTEEQKMLRARAHKLCVENNRRRKAQEERRKAVEVREQKLHEQILQQRRQKLLEATEQHQRAHLPQSQRRRPVICRPAHLLDGAVRKIQHTFSLCDPQSLFYPARLGAYRRCHSSSDSPVASSKQPRQRQLSAAVAYVKLLQEKCTDDLQDRDLFFYSKLREKQHPLVARWENSTQENPQDVSQPGRAENLSCLEMEKSHHSPSHSSGHSHTSTPSHSPGHSHTCSPPNSPGHSHTSSQSHTTCLSGTYSLSHTTGHAKNFSHSPSPGPSKTPGSSHIPGPSHTTGPSQTSAIRSASPSWLHPSLLVRSCQSHSPSEQSHGVRCASVVSVESGSLPQQKETGLGSQPTHSQRTEEPEAPREAGYMGPQATEGREGEELQSQPKTEPTPASAAPSVQSDQNAEIQSGTAAILDDQTPCGAPDELRGFSDSVPLAVPHGAWSGPDPPPTELSGLPGGESPAESSQGVGDHTDRSSSHTPVTFTASPTKEHGQGEGVGQPVRTPAETTFMANAEPWPTNHISVLHVDVNTDTPLSKDKERACADKSGPSNQINASDHTEKGSSTGSTDSAPGPIPGTSDVRSIKGILKKKSKYAADLSGSLNFPTEAASSVRDGVELANPDRRELDSVKKRLRWFDEECENVAVHSSGRGKGVTKVTGGKDTPPQLQKRPGAGRPGAELIMACVSSTGYHFVQRAWSDSGGREGALLERRLGKSSSPRGGSRPPRAPRRAGSALPGSRSASSRRGGGARPQSAAGSGWEDQCGARTRARTLSPRPACRGNVGGLLPSNKAPDGCATQEHHTAVTVSGLTFTQFPPACTLPRPTTENVSRGMRISSQQDPLDSANGESSLYPNSASAGLEVYHLCGTIRSTLTHKESNSGFRRLVSA